MVMSRCAWGICVLYVCTYVYWLVQVYACVFTGVYGGLRSVLGVSSSLFTLVFETGSPTGSGAHWLARIADQ